MEKYKDQPFVLLGVNFEGNPAQARSRNEAAGVTWRSWWAGGPEFQLPRFYPVGGLPTLFVIDRAGVLRHINVYGPDLERAIETLLNEKAQLST